MMEGKVIKEELPDKDSVSCMTAYSEAQRRSKGSVEGGGSPASGRGSPPSPALNGGSGGGSPEGGRPPPARLKRFLATLLQFGADMGQDVGERVRGLVHGLLSSSLGVEEFQLSLQEATNFPLRPFVLPFLRAALPPLQREVLAQARQAKQVPLQYVLCHESLVLETGGASGGSGGGPGTGDPADMFLGAPVRAQHSPSPAAGKRTASEAFYESGVTNGCHIPLNEREASDHLGVHPHQAKRPAQLPPAAAPLLYPLPPHLLEYQREYEQPPGPADNRHTHDEWKNINTMLNCILSMVEKTKRALAILQQRGSGQDCSPDVDMKRLAGEIMAATVRQTEERVAEVRRRAEDAVNQVKRQAVAELQRAAASERARLLRIPGARCQQPVGAGAPGGAAGSATGGGVSPPPAPDHHNSCWNCGRKAQETCSGCNVARYCGAFCQHKDWETHHQVCCGRDQKPLVGVPSPPRAAPPGPPGPLSLPPQSSSTATNNK